MPARPSASDSAADVLLLRLEAEALLAGGRVRDAGCWARISASARSSSVVRSR